MSRAESVMENNPDLALKILDSVRNRVPELPRSLRMQYEILHASAQNIAFIVFTTFYDGLPFTLGIPFK